jgi:hypothetical protein
MTRRQILGLAGGLLVVPRAVPTLEAQEVVPLDFVMLARRRVAEAVRRLAADGWRVRDQVFTQRLLSGQVLRTPVHLLRGVQYLFVTAARPVECRFHVRLLAATGQPVAALIPEDNSRVAAVWHEPATTARCLLELSVPSDAPAGDAAALYVYR